MQTIRWSQGDIRRFLMLAMLVVLGVAMGAMPRPAAAYEQAVQPTRSLPGGLFAFFATGFEPEERVAFWVNEPPTCVQERGSAELCAHTGGKVRANHRGRADWTWKMPPDGRYGTWTMVARGLQSGEQREISFEVVETPPDFSLHQPAGQGPYDAAVAPEAGAPGTEFSFFALGYDGIERVRFWGFDPLNRMHYLGDFGSNEDGRVDWHWESPPDAIPGRWFILMRGDRSQVERVVRLDIRPAQDFPEEAEPRDPYDYAVTPRAGYPRTKFTFFADNFESGERIVYRIVDSAGQEHLKRKVAANQWGRVDLEWRTPYDALPGIWRWIVEGEWGDRRVVEFEIWPVETPSAPYDSAVAPGEGRPGTEFSFFATGFESKEAIDYVCLNADGLLESRASTRANERGRADWTCKTPSNAVPGTWTTIAHGRDSHRQRSISFVVSDDAPWSAPLP